MVGVCEFDNQLLGSHLSKQARTYLAMGHMEIEPSPQRQPKLGATLGESAPDGSECRFLLADVVKQGGPGQIASPGSLTMDMSGADHPMPLVWYGLIPIDGSLGIADEQPIDVGMLLCGQRTRRHRVGQSCDQMPPGTRHGQFIAVRSGDQRCLDLQSTQRIEVGRAARRAGSICSPQLLQVP